MNDSYLVVAEITNWVLSVMWIKKSYFDERREASQVEELFEVSYFIFSEVEHF